MSDIFNEKKDPERKQSEKTSDGVSREIDFDEAYDAVLKQAVRVLASEENASSWLNSPNIALGMRKPVSLLGSETGLNQVFSVLGAIEFGGSV